MRRLITAGLIALVLAACGSSFDAAAFDATTLFHDSDLLPDMRLWVADLPAGTKADPPPAMATFREVRSPIGQIGGITVLAYNTTDEATRAYDAVKEDGALPGIGDTGSFHVDAGSITGYRYTFRRCRAVVSAIFASALAPVPELLDLQGYVTRLDGRIQESALCSK